MHDGRIVAMPVVSVGTASRVVIRARRVRSHHGTPSTWLDVREGGARVFLVVRSARGWEGVP
jgi:hypothetical protein